MEIKPKKSLGQNFLSDKNIIKSIVDIGNIKNNNVIIEIGPGTGNLTEFILKKKPKKIFVVEKDKNLVDLLNKKFKEKINIINEDILKFRTSLFIMSILLLNLSYNNFTKLESFSITKNFFGFFFKINSVKFPVPGPTSKITSLSSIIPISTIDFIMFLSVKKF